MRFIYILIHLLCLSRLVVAQDNYQVTSYGVDDGLPQSSIWDITQDRNGFLWVSTSDGLCRFDGYNFKVYKNNPHDSNSICGNRDHRFYTDSSGVMWIICWNGVSIYNEQFDNFTTIFKYEPALPTDNFNTVFGEDERYIWAGLSNYGLIKADKRTHTVTQVRYAGTIDLAKEQAWSGGFVERGRIWLCTGAGGYVYEIGGNKIYQLGEDRSLTSIFNLNDSEALAGGDQSLTLIKKQTLKFKKTPVDLNNNYPQIIVNMLSESKDEVILACHKGVFYFDLRTFKMVKSIQSFDSQQKNKYAFARCIFKDRAKNLWIGTNGDGLKKINFPYKKFLAYNSHSPVSNLVKSIYADSQHLFVGYFNNGLDIFDRKTGFIKNMAITGWEIGIGNNVYALCNLSPDELILHSVSYNKINLYNPKTGAIKSITHLLTALVPEIGEMPTMYPFCIRTRKGRILTIAGEYLIWLNEPESPSVRPSILRKFEGETPGCAFEDEKGDLWIGTMNCVYCYDGSRWTKVVLPENVQVKSINKDLNGNLWIGTVKGIYLLDSNRNVRQYFNEANGMLANQFVYGLLRDNDGNMWFSHNKGLSVYLVKEKKFRHYFKEDGLQSSEFNTNSYFKSEDGMLFFGGINGVNAFYPHDIQDNPVIPEVRITTIKLFDEPLKTKSAYWNIHELTLPYTDNSLSFEFAALEFTNPRKNEYAYMMEDLDKDWIKAGDKRFARYAAIPPGNYTFKVKASNNDGLWQENPTCISITIVPPYWQQWWFRILAILFFVFCIAGIIIWIQRQRHRKQIRAMELSKKIQLERERISRDLHDTVGTQLSLISNNIEWVAHPLKVISEGEKEEKLQFVNNTARDIIATLRETIWALSKEQISLEEFSDKLKAFVQRQFLVYPDIALKFREEISEQIILGPSEALNLFRICQEAIANALKYAEASNISIDIQNTEGRYRISIIDDGKGFDVNSVDASLHNGLENMKYRAADISSTIEINSVIGKGSRVLIIKNRADAVLNR